MKIYITPHEINQVVCAAAARGIDSEICEVDKGWRGGPVLTYGILRGTGHMILLAKALKEDFYYLDHGYFRRGHYHGYYRLTKNALQSDGLGDFPPDRWRNLAIAMKEWRGTGSHVLIIPPTEAMGAFLGVDPDKWVENVRQKLALHSDRPQIVRNKAHNASLTDHLDDCWAVVTHSSNAAVEAVLAGIPAFTTGFCAANPVSETDLGKIEAPGYPERSTWAANLAYGQFTLKELRKGVPWRIFESMSAVPATAAPY